MAGYKAETSFDQINKTYQHYNSHSFFSILIANKTIFALFRKFFQVVFKNEQRFGFYDDQICHLRNFKSNLFKLELLSKYLFDL